MLGRFLVSIGFVMGGVLSGTVMGGTLEPPASAVDGSGNPVPTGASPPAWDKKLDSTNGEADGCNSDRFTCVLDGAAVRDNETGLVWEREPAVPVHPQFGSSWIVGIGHCATRLVGGRKGWQLPMREQLASLLDSSNSNPALPTGHPFLNVQSGSYWSATSSARVPTFAWAVKFFGAAGDAVDSIGPKSGSTGTPAWCVRGGQTFDGQDLNSLPAP